MSHVESYRCSYCGVEVELRQCQYDCPVCGKYLLAHLPRSRKGPIATVGVSGDEMGTKTADWK